MAPMTLTASPVAASASVDAAAEVVMTPAYSPASLGLSNDMQQPPVSTQSEQPVEVDSSPAVAAHKPRRLWQENDVCPSSSSSTGGCDAGCGNMPASVESLATHAEPVVQNLRHAGRRLKETPCAAVSLESLEKAQGYTTAAKEAVTSAAAQGLSAADDLGQRVEPYVNSALTGYCLPAFAAVQRAHTEYVVPSVAHVRDTYNDRYHHQYVLPTVAKAGDLIGQAKTVYMEDYHQQYVVHSVNRTMEVVGELPQRMAGASMQLQREGEQQAQAAH